MSSQTVYFTNPSTISGIQSQIGTIYNSPLFNVNNNLYTGTANLINASLQSLMTCTGGTGAGQDANGIAHFGLFCVVGNAFSGNEVFTATGTINPTGVRWNENHYVRLASQSKIIGGMVVAKMMEEGYLSPLDSVSTYIPEFSGTGYYITYATGTIGSFQSGPGSYTGTLAPYNLNTLTIAHLLGFQLGIPSSEFLTGRSLTVWQTTTPVDYALNYSYQECIKALDLGRVLGASGCYAVGNGLRDSGYDGFYKSFGYVNGLLNDYILTLCNCLKKGSVILSFRPGELETGFNGLFVPRAQYGVAFTILSYLCNKALQLKGGPTLTQYIRDKLFTPLEINDGLWWGNCETGPSDRFSNTVEVSFRTAYTLYTGPFATGTQSPGLPLNTLVWSSQYPNTSYSSSIVPNPILQDPPNLNGGLIGKPSLYCKLLKLLINKGVYKNQAGQMIQVMSRPAVNWMFNSFGAAGQLYLARSLYNSGTPTANQVWCCGFTKQDDSLASSYNIENPGNIGFNQFPISTNLCNWGGFYGTAFCFDQDSGYYICAGAQEPASGNNINTIDFQRQLVPLMSYASRLN